MKKLLIKLRQEVENCSDNLDAVQAALDTIEEIDRILERIDDADAGDVPEWLIQLLN